MFTPSRCKDARLAAYGITNHVPCINADMCLNAEDANKVHLMIAELNTALNRNAKKQLFEGTLRVNDKTLAFRKPPPWNFLDAETRTQQSELRQRTFKSLEQQVSEQTVQAQSGALFLGKCALDIFCHVCRHKRRLSEHALLQQTTWKQVRCNECMLQRKASKWLCECGKPWHMCEVHRPIGLQVHRDGIRKVLRDKGTRLNTGMSKRKLEPLGANPARAYRKRGKRTMPQQGNSSNATPPNNPGTHDTHMYSAQPTRSGVKRIGPCPAPVQSSAPQPPHQAKRLHSNRTADLINAPRFTANAPKRKHIASAKVEQPSRRRKSSSSASVVGAQPPPQSQRMLEYIRRGIIAQPTNEHNYKRPADAQQANLQTSNNQAHNTSGTTHNTQGEESQFPPKVKRPKHGHKG